MIKSIEMKNWKTHKDTRLDFSKGTNILLGQMGAGKSSVMDAISFALFGTYPAIQHRRVAVEEIIMNRPEQKQRASVKLDFEADGVQYSVERVLEALVAHLEVPVGLGGIQFAKRRVIEEGRRAFHRYFRETKRRKLPQDFVFLTT